VVIDLAIFVPVGISEAAVLLTLFGGMPIGGTLAVYVAVAAVGTYVYAQLARINERQADLLATDILGEKESMLALCREAPALVPDPEKLSRSQRLLQTHPAWERRRRAVEKHTIRPHPRRLSGLINRFI
jgi:Zn-dependent protease with chaperone function